MSREPFAVVGRETTEDGEECIHVTGRKEDIRVVHMEQGHVIKLELTGVVARAVDEAKERGTEAEVRMEESYAE